MLTPNLACSPSSMMTAPSASSGASPRKRKNLSPTCRPSPRATSAWRSRNPTSPAGSGNSCVRTSRNSSCATRATRQLMVRLGKPFPEVKLLSTAPGLGVVGAHVFAAYICDPTRFDAPSQLIRYCQLGIRDRSSDDKPLGYEQLDRHGHGLLKA